MSDYTPTDGEILTAVVLYRTISGADAPPPSIETIATPEVTKRYLGEYQRWLAEHDAAILEELADEVHATLSDPNRKRPRDPRGEFATDLLNDVAWAVHLIREKARQRREGQS